MEIELKYSFTTNIDTDEIFSDLQIKRYSVGELKIKKMNALYLDSDDLVLTNKKIALRIRQEGDRLVKTLKWGGMVKDGMHKRHEINVPITNIPNDYCLENLVEGFEISNRFENYSQHAQSEEILLADGITESHEIIEKIKMLKRISPQIVMRFTRKEIRLKTKQSTSVLSIDNGVIIGNGKEIPIKELEIELETGKEGNIIEIGKKLCEKYGLKPEKQSKLERGLQLFK